MPMSWTKPQTCAPGCTEGRVDGDFCHCQSCRITGVSLTEDEGLCESCHGAAATARWLKRCDAYERAHPEGPSDAEIEGFDPYV